jgi:NADPH:quinone reductase-like Zn-dependent oxidoreductase
MQMKAIHFYKYGSPTVLEFKEVEIPSLKDNEVLIKVQAASANPLDWHAMRGAPFVARLEFGLQKPRDPRLGADVAGRVEAIGKQVTRFKVGDAVFGDIFKGSFAEYASASEELLALKPAHLTFEAAAAVPVAAFTA